MSTNLCTNAKLMLLVFLSLAIAGCEREDGTSFFQSQSQPTASAPVLNVNVVRVAKVEEAEKISVFFGTLKPNRQSQLRFSNPGRVEQFFKKVGEVVQAGEQIASLELDAGGIAAPYDCIIASQNVVAGDSVSPQSLALTVPVLVQVNLALEITQNPPDPIWVIVGNDSAKSRLKTVSPLESTAGSRTVTLEIDDSIVSTDWSFGQTVKIRFRLPTEKSGYWIPLSALSRESTGLWSVLVVANENADSAGKKNTVQRRIVELIQLEDNRALTQGALADGDMVILNGSHRVVPGQLVSPTEIAKPSTGAGE